VCTQITNVCFRRFDQLNGKLVKLREVIRSEVFSITPIEAQPTDVRFDRFDVFNIFLARIGIIIPKIAESVKFGSKTEIETDRFRMTDMQVAIRLRRKSSMNPTAVFVLLKILDNYVSNTMRRRSLCRYRYRPFTAWIESLVYCVSLTLIEINRSAAICHYGADARKDTF